MSLRDLAQISIKSILKFIWPKEYQEKDTSTKPVQSQYSINPTNKHRPEFQMNYS